MKYKVLLTGNGHSTMDDFFSIMSNEFQCMTTSTRVDDILNHINYFAPEAFVFTMQREPDINIERVIEALEQVDREKMKVVLVGDEESCNAFLQVKPALVNLTFIKPVNARTIRDKIAASLAQERAFLEMEKTIREEQEKVLAELQRQRDLALKEKAQADREKNAGPKHILIIDDDPVMLRVIKEELRDEYNVATAISGKIGLNFLSRRSTDLILLDYEMPEENGLMVLKKLRADESTKNIPVVFLTGLNDGAKIKQIIEMKPQGYLLKPVNREKLIEAIRGVIG